ncbi:MAG: hypothetical protein E7043_02295 [Lentisphaerae bacterium]|nr:hypothetical protein [Lentisphaerota bacterium]
MKKLIRPAMLITPLILGVLFPEVRVLAQSPYNFIKWALCVMIFINSLQIRPSELKPCKEHWVLLAANILLGVVPFFLLQSAGCDTMAQAAFFTGIAPTAVASSVVVALLNGSIGFALTAFVISNVGIATVLLFLLPLVTGNLALDFFFSVLRSLIEAIALPLLAAQILCRIFPRLRDSAGKLKMCSLSLWSLSLFIIVAVARDYLDLQNDTISGMFLPAGVSLFMCALNFITGFWINRRFRRESSQMLGQKNTTLALFLALEYSGGAAVLALVFYVIYHNIWNSLQLLAFPGKIKPVAPDADLLTEAEH